MNSLEIVDISSVEHSQWHSLLEASPVSSWFQTPDAYSFYLELSKINSNSVFQPFGCAVLESGRLTGLLICYIQSDGCRLKSFASRRAIIQGGPLLSPNISVEALQLLLKSSVKLLGNNVIYIEIRNFDDYSRWHDSFLAAGFDYNPHYNFHVPLPNPKYSKDLSRNIREAIQDGVTVVEHPTDSQFVQFYNILSQLYYTKIHKPLPPLEFFELLRHQPHVLTCVVLAPSNGSVNTSILYSSSVIGGFIGPYTAGTLYDMYSCGLTNVPRRWHPSEIITDFALRKASELGCQYFDFMGAGAPDDGGYGVRDFKAKFGGTLLTHGRYLYICKPLLYRLGKFVISHHLLR